MTNIILIAIYIFLAYSFIAIGYFIAIYQVNVFDGEDRNRQEVLMAGVIASVLWPISWKVAKDKDQGGEEI